MPSRRSDERDDESPHDARRRHKSTPPKSNRAPSSVRDAPSERPKLVTRDDSYFDPRDVYYLSDDDWPKDHPWSASRREDLASGSRDRSSPRRRDDSRGRHRTDRESPRTSRPHSEVRRRPHSEERYRPRDDDDEREHRRRSRRSNSRDAARPRRSATAAPSPREDHHRAPRDQKPPPSASRSGRVRSPTGRSSSTRGRGRSSSLTTKERVEQSKHILMSAAKAALQAGAMAALKMHEEPGPWVGLKGTKVIGTALSAAAVDTYIENRRPNMKGGMRHNAAKQAAQVCLVNLVAKPAVKKTRFGKA